MTPLMATVTRRHHPLDGQVLAVVGRMCRHGRDELLLVLADGSKSLVPVAWTGGPRARPGGAPRPPSAPWRTCWPRPHLPPNCPPGAMPCWSRLHGDHLPRRTTVQPAQLSLLGDEALLGPPPLLAQFPETELATALGLLAGLIAKASKEGVNANE